MTMSDDIDPCKCGKPAVWLYMPGDGQYCDDCVSRGCSCNIDYETGLEDTDELGRLLPCCEYGWVGDPPGPEVVSG